jgi:hypothetical protein
MYKGGYLSMSQTIIRTNTNKLVTERVLRTQNGVLSVKIYVEEKQNGIVKDVLEYLKKLQVKQPQKGFYEMIKDTEETYSIKIEQEIEKISVPPNLQTKAKEVSKLKLTITTK